MTTFRKSLASLTVLGFIFCSPAREPQHQMPDYFQAYWFAGEAELSSYHLHQARYGELHEGQAVLVFVTEDMSRKKLVKLDRPDRHPNDAVKVMKLNHTRNFNTGIYPYSVMTSVFTPIDLGHYPHSFKASCSVQEWCGHAYMELTSANRNFNLSIHSYFEDESQESKQLPKVWQEDEMFNRIRIHPRNLPLGTVEVLPSLIYARMRHSDMNAEEARAEIIENPDGTATYTLTYTQLDRVFSITYQQNFPFRIEGWQERYTSGWGNSAQVLTTTATRQKTIKLDYWNKNGMEDAHWRDSLMIAD